MDIKEQIVAMQQALLAPFPGEAIHWRVGSTNSEKTKGMALAYLDARDVMDRLDEVFGVDGWQESFKETPTNRIICRLACRFPAQDSDGLWVTKSDGAGVSDIEGEKGAISDALKRAAVKFGIGRYLYRLPAQWVPIDAWGKSYRIQRGYEPALPEWALPSGSRPKPGSDPAKMKLEFRSAVSSVMLRLSKHYAEEESLLIMHDTLEALGWDDFDQLVASEDRDKYEEFYNRLREAENL
jgi:hypothetical protein